MDEITEELEDGETQEREERVDEWRKKQRSQRMDERTDREARGWRNTGARLARERMDEEIQELEDG